MLHSVKRSLALMPMLLTVVHSISAYAGGTNGGGTSKPNAEFGLENLGAILADAKISENSNLQAIHLEKIDKTGYHYAVVLGTPEGAKCLRVNVWNTDAALNTEVKVKEVVPAIKCEVKTQKAPFATGPVSTILNDAKVFELLGLNYSIEDLDLIEVKNDTLTYEIWANNRPHTAKCVFHVDVKDQKVKSTEVLSGCSSEPPPQIPSVLTKYQSIFDQFNQLDETAPYDNYLHVVRKLTPEKRKEVIAYMRRSEPKYYQVYKKYGKAMADFFKANPGATNDEAMFILAKVMGFPTDGQQGIFIPLIVGMELAPFFIVDAE